VLYLEIKINPAENTIADLPIRMVDKEEKAKVLEK
jgi:hypothetical protein